MFTEFLIQRLFMRYAGLDWLAWTKIISLALIFGCLGSVLKIIRQEPLRTTQQAFMFLSIGSWLILTPWLAALLKYMGLSPFWWASDIIAYSVAGAPVFVMGSFLNAEFFSKTSSEKTPIFSIYLLLAMSVGGVLGSVIIQSFALLFEEVQLEQVILLMAAPNFLLAMAFIQKKAKGILVAGVALLLSLSYMLPISHLRLLEPGDKLIYYTEAITSPLIVLENNLFGVPTTLLKTGDTFAFQGAVHSKTKENLIHQISYAVDIYKRANPQGKVLSLGVAGGGFIKALLGLDHTPSVVGVDLEPKLDFIQKNYFGLSPKNNFEMQFKDARLFLEENIEKYSFIFQDTFNHKFIPERLMTQEFFDLVQEDLDTQGCLLIHMHAVTDFTDTKSEFLVRMDKTLKTVFKDKKIRYFSFDNTGVKKARSIYAIVSENSHFVEAAQAAKMYEYIIPEELSLKFKPYSDNDLSLKKTVLKMFM